MSKYIDAEKLIAEIKRRIEETKSMKPAFDQFWAGQISAFKGVIKITESLQQEPRFPQYDNIVDKVFGAGNLEGWERDEAEMLVALAKEELLKSLQQEQPEGLHFIPLIRLIQKIPSKNWNNTVNNYAKKLRDCLIKEGYLKDAEVLQGYISYMNGNNVPMATMDEREQPEVDLDRAVVESYSLPLLNRQVSREELDKFARHFYELGLSTMRRRLADPEYNREAIEKMKTEYPVDESNARKEE